MIKGKEKRAGNNPGIFENRRGKITLAIESGVAAGSISLLLDKEEIDFWIGTGAVSRSEDILEAVKKILEKNNIKIESVKRLAISSGPGSFTGLRIGFAIIKGLSKAIDGKVWTASLLEALIGEPLLNGTYLTAVPFGKKQVCWQTFELQTELKTKKVRQNDLSVSGIEDFIESLPDIKADVFVLHQSIFEELKTLKKTIEKRNKKIVNAGANLAKYIGETAVKSERLNSKQNLIINYAGTDKILI